MRFLLKSLLVLFAASSGVQSARAEINFDSNWTPLGGSYVCTSTTQFGSFTVSPGGGKNLKVSLSGGGCIHFRA
jgi:hypothetical protein